MSVKQIKWILNKALLLILAYEGRILTDREFEGMTDFVEKTVRESKGNEYCRKLMIRISREGSHESGKRRQVPAEAAYGEQAPAEVRRP